jgi:hypothetical protein
MDEEPQPKGRYRQILPQAYKPLNTPEGEENLHRLAEAMTDDGWVGLHFSFVFGMVVILST